MDLTKASKKYQEYCRAEKHPSEGNKKRTFTSVILIHICYLEEFVTREEVGGRLQDGSHGFSQLLMHCSCGAGRVRLGPEYKLEKHIEREN